MAMSEAARKAHAAYQKQWAHDHPDKIKAIAERHWEKVAREAEEKRAAEIADAVEKIKES